MHERTRFDAFKALLAIMKSELGIGLVSAETPVLHSALKQLSLENPRLFGEYKFDERGDFPYSHEFYNQLVMNEMAGNLSCLSPNFDRYLILNKAVTNYKKWIKPLFTSEELKELKRIATALGVKIGRPE